MLLMTSSVVLRLLLYNASPDPILNLYKIITVYVCSSSVMVRSDHKTLQPASLRPNSISFLNSFPVSEVVKFILVHSNQKEVIVKNLCYRGTQRPKWNFYFFNPK